jgi:hypothetical protein
MAPMKLISPAVLAATALLLAGCQTPCPAPDTGPVALLYRCEDGSVLQVTFTRNPNNARVVQEGYAPADLTARSTGLGFRYADGGAELQGRRSEVRWVRPGAAETICRERP